MSTATVNGMVMKPGKGLCVMFLLLFGGLACRAQNLVCVLFQLTNSSIAIMQFMQIHA